MCFYLRNWQVTFLLYTLGVKITEYIAKAPIEPRDYRVVFLIQKKHLGYVTIDNGSLYPGAAVQKHLPPVGDIHITGIVNISGILAQLTLQTTRISTVISLADTIARGLLPILNTSGLIQTL